MASVLMSVWGLRMTIAATACLCALWVLGWPAMARAADTPKEEPTKPVSRALQDRCIPLRRVRSIKIVDNQTIIWIMRGGRPAYFKMTLHGRCPGLVARGAFVHSSSNGRLCDIGEWIRVAGGTRAICPIESIEPWTPPASQAAPDADQPDDGAGDTPDAGEK